LDFDAAVSVRAARQRARDRVCRVAYFEEEDFAEREAMMAQQRITRDDLETRFRQLQDNVQGRVDDKKSTLVTIGVVGGVVLLLVFFLLGSRRGKKKTTLVEIRRV
jgi:acetolactate synthase small subunit